MTTEEAPPVSRLGTEAVRADDPGKAVQRPVEALDIHLALIDWLSRPQALDSRTQWWSTFGGDNTQALMREYAKAYGVWGASQEDIASLAHSDLSARQTRVEREQLSQAITQYMTPELFELAWELAQTMEPRPLRDVDPFMPYGFIFFGGKGLPYFSAQPVSEWTYIRALSWGPHQVGIAKDSPVTEDMQLEAPLQGTEGAIQGIAHGLAINLYVDYESAEQSFAFLKRDGLVADRSEFARHLKEQRPHLGPLIFLDHNPWAYGFPWAMLSSPEPDTGSLGPDGYPLLALHTGNMRRFLLAYWQLLEEQVVAVERKYDRPAAKRAQRIRKLMDGDVVHVARLRRLYDERTGEEMTHQRLVERFTHRWRVRSHWRHYDRGQGLLEDHRVLLDHAFKWPRDGVVLRLTDPTTGLQEKVRAVTIENDVATLQWAPTRIKEGVVEIERVGWIKGHASGAHGGPLVERYDVISVER